MILIVDDHADSGESLKRMLCKLGHRAQAVLSGDEALSFARVIKPKLIVLDIMMPGISGMDVLRALRKDRDLRDVPVLIYSAFCESLDVEELRGLGVRDCLSKAPTHWTELLGRIEMAYGRWVGAAELSEVGV